MSKPKTTKLKLRGHIRFPDHHEVIIKAKTVEGNLDIYELITNEGLYVYDASEPYDKNRCRLYKQVITKGSFPQTIKSQLHECEYLYVDLTYC